MPPLKRFASTGCTTAKTLGGKGTPCGQPGAEEYGQRAQPVSRAEKALAHGRASGSTNPGRLRSERVFACAIGRNPPSAARRSRNPRSRGVATRHAERKHHERWSECEQPSLTFRVIATRHPAKAENIKPGAAPRPVGRERPA